MKDNALFFPFINVPNDEWFVRILLYWDKVVSIVPTNFVVNPERFSPHMRNFVELGLVEQLMPAQYLWNRPNFAHPFLSYVRFESENRTRLNKPVHTGQYSLVHVEKIDHLIGEPLVALDFADRHSNEWYAVEKWVAEAFMTYLATVLGNLEEINAIPVTNHHKSYELLSGQPLIAAMQLQHYQREALRTIALRQILPCPSLREGSVTSSDVAEFKENHRELLSRFRNFIESNLIDVCNIRDVVEREERFSRFLSEAAHDKTEIIELMRSRWKAITFGALVPIMGSTLALSQPNGLLGGISAAAGLAAAVYQALDSSRQYREFLTMPLAYGAFAEKYFRDTQY